MKKKVLKIFNLLLLSMTVTCTPVMASDVQVSNVAKLEADTRIEQVEWKYRYHNGRLQRRLWSYTYGYWKTPWTYV